MRGRTFSSRWNRPCVVMGCALATVGIIAGIASVAVTSHAERDRRVMVSASFILASLQRKGHTTAGVENRQQ
jgi:hypothetical protein